MRQTELLGVVMSLKPGQAINISREDMREAAGGSLTGLDLLGGVRDSDVVEFIAQIARNWEIVIERNPITDNYTIYKPDDIVNCLEFRPRQFRVGHDFDPNEKVTITRKERP